MVEIIFEGRQGGETYYDGYLYGDSIRISEDGKSYEIYDPIKEKVVFSSTIDTVKSIRINNTIEQTVLEWLEDFIRNHEHVSQYWEEELEAAWAVHDIITHHEAAVPCTSDCYRGYEGIEISHHMEIPEGYKLVRDDEEDE